MNGFIYKITNDINNKIYIGKTLHSSVQKRFQEHCKDAQKNSSNRPLYKAMQKYGIEHFCIEEVEKIDISLLSQREQYWIKYYNSYGKNGYNATLGGDGKQLYDYNAIVEGFLSGKLIKELAEEFECCPDTISQAINLAGFNSKNNTHNYQKKGIVAKDKNQNVIAIFSSRSEAVEWLIKNKYTKSQNIDNISATIGRVANGKRKSAYNLFWENI